MRISGGEYHGAMIETVGKRRWKYGYFETKVKYPNIAGGWCNPFLVNELGWPPEIDFAEVFDTNGYCQLQIREGTTDYIVGTWNFVDLGVWHIFGVLWEPDMVVFFVDGYEVARMTAWVQQVNMAFYYCALLGNWAPPVAEQLPATMDVEYLKVWQRTI
jgi:beta-glucanase (GH16 family)